MLAIHSCTRNQRAITLLPLFQTEVAQEAMKGLAHVQEDHLAHLNALVQAQTPYLASRNPRPEECLQVCSRLAPKLLTRLFDFQR